MPVQIVGGLLVRKRQALLVLRTASRDAFPGLWGFAGGHVDPGETHSEALVRELVEELGVIVHEPSTEPALVLHHPGVVLYVWVITDWQREPSNMQPEEHDEVGWFDLESALALEFAHPELRDLLQDVLG